ncbi:thioredoxin family protein [Patescibacteria group bacterium]|nr:thioredoxin family protein [Patescibacteria group bacterium]
MVKLKKNINFTTLILVILLVGIAFFAGMMWMKNKNLKQGKTVGVNQATQNEAEAQVTPEPLETVIGGFAITKDEICYENEKPLSYYFGYSGCPHCQWNHPILQAVAEKFPTQIVFHDNMDKLDKLSAADGEILNKYQEIHGGAVPFFVFGCKYARLGSGETYGEADEEKFLTALICKLTNGQPEKVCSPVQDLIDQVK